MEEPQPLKDFIAGRLLAKAQEQLKDEEKKAEETPLTAPLAVADFVPANPFIKIEKNLASLGFFTPSSKRIKDLKEKTIAYRKEIDGKKIEVKATIVPSAKYGLPITADQDKYLALQKIVTDIYRAAGKVSNPVSFSSAELLKSLGLADAGKNFHEVGEWLNLMYSTTIISEGVVYFAGKKKWVTDRFRVFNRAVSVGAELGPGVTAEKNYVWFSDWQLENINNNHLLPIDRETYNQLKNHIAKILVPLLQIWLYATRDEGSFEKRYEELSEILNIHQYHQPSRIKEQLGFSLDELKTYGYLADWKIEKTSDNKHYKIIFYHGEKFHRDRRRRLASKETTNEQISTETTNKIAVEVSEPPAEQGIDPTFVAELTRRGVVREEAIKLLQNLEPGQPLLDQLEYYDSQKNKPDSSIRGPGFLVHFIKNNVAVPEDFETSHTRQRREEARQAQDREAEEKMRLESLYEGYCRQEVDRYIARLDRSEYEGLLRQKRQELLKQDSRYSKWLENVFADHINRRVRADIAAQAGLLTFHSFCARERSQAIRDNSAGGT